MTVIKLDRLSARVITPGTDEVMSGCPIPEEGALVGIDFELKVTTSVSINTAKTVAFGVDGWVVQIDDPATAVAWDALWDGAVPKDAPGITIDMSDSADAATFWEPTEFSQGEMLDIMVDQPRRFTRMRKWLGFADVQTGFVAGSPDKYTPTHASRMGIGKVKYNCVRNSAAMLGFGAPAMDFVSAADPNVMPSQQVLKNEWTWLKYVDELMEEVLRGAMGFGSALEVEAEAMDFIEDLLTQLNFEDTADHIDAATWNCMMVGQFIIDVPGRLHVAVISAE